MVRAIKIVMGIVLATGLVSCSDDGGADKKPKDDRYKAAHAEQVVKGIDEFLGKGYKGYQFYANHRSCTLPLFDLSDHGVVDIQQGTDYQGRFASSETKYQFYEQFSANVAAG